MPGTFFGMNIARSGMLTYNTWLNTTGHNIANVKTKGYSKQTVNQQATVPISVGTTYGMLGTGVDAVSIDSQRDVYYDEKYRMSNAEYGKYEKASMCLSDIMDQIYAKTTDSGAITNSMDMFLQGISSLQDASGNEALRQQVVGYGNLLLQNINEAADRLKEIQRDVNGQIADTVDQINAYAQEIASLTQQINTLEIYGNKANDLRDQRAYILDQMSELVDVRAVEKEPYDGNGLKQYIVSIDNAVLVDTYSVNLLRYESRDTYNAMDDIDKLYDLRWASGQDFGIHDTGLGGKLQALFELRDGNNGEVFAGKLKNSVAKTDKTITVADVNELGSSLFKLQIPECNGILNVDHVECQYEYFECSLKEDGTYEYVFHLKDEIGVNIDAGRDVQVSDAVNFRGIPYYQSQLNEFVRTFSYYFNDQHMAGYDLYDNAGTQMFVARDKVTDEEYNFSSDTEVNFNPSKEWKYDSIYKKYGSSEPDTALAESAANKAFTFRSDTGRFTTSKLAEAITDRNTSAGRTEYRVVSYYKMTASNVSIDSKILKNGNLLAASDSPGGIVKDEAGNVILDDKGKAVSNGKNLEKISALRYNKTMFKEGEPANFLKVLNATVGIDGRKSINNSDNAKNIRDSIDGRRLSKAGVDEDEEGQNLIICQNLLNYQYKVLSVMNQVLDKLINGTAV